MIPTISAYNETTTETNNSTTGPTNSNNHEQSGKVSIYKYQTTPVKLSGRSVGLGRSSIGVKA
jgi:hypothetical protein